MKKKKFFSIAILVCTIALSGCADAMPDLTDEQRDIIAEYSAQQLLKYCSYYDSGIDTTALTEEPETETETESEIETESANQEQENKDESEESNLDGNNDTPSVELLDVNEADFAEMLVQDEFNVTYDKYEIDISYPQDENAFFSLDAPNGKKFLVLFFTIQNMSDSEVKFDVLHTDAKFKINVNEMGYKTNLSTLLMDDLSTYEDKFNANETKQAVLILQANEADLETADSIDLQIEVQGQVSQVKLF